jgi:serine protease Do
MSKDQTTNSRAKRQARVFRSSIGHWSLVIGHLTLLAVRIPTHASEFRGFDALAIERQTVDIAPKIVAATVGIVLSDDDIETSGIGYGGSGVIVSAEGLILTAAHVLEGCGDQVIVLLPEGGRAQARVCGFLGRGDLGVIQLSDKGPWPFLPMAEVDKVSPGTICVGAGHTGRIDPKRPPPLRMGRVLGERQGESFIDENGDAADLDRVLVTDAPFLPGDSGGPLVNLAGQVIGVHSSIGPDHRENLHVPIWQFRRHWAKLTGGVKRPLPKLIADELALSDAPHMGPLRRLPIFDYRVTVERSWSGGHPNFLRKFTPFVGKLPSLPVQVFVEDRPAALGCVVSADGLILTIASSVAEGNTICRIHEKDYEARLVATDDTNNLALLKVPAEKLSAVEWFDAASPSVGAWLVSPGVDGKALAVGIVGLTRRSIPDPEQDGSLKETHGFLGIELQPKAKDARIGRIVADSAAANAGLSVNDVVQALNEHPIHRAEELIETLRRLKPGDKVKVEISREGKKMLLEATLGKRPSKQQEDDAEFATWNRSTGGVSTRKTNLPDVLTHDGFVSPRHCGGPLLDLHGHVIGLNIARADRTATFALPAEVVKKAVEKLISDSAVGAGK